jgi:4-amino-4-deoxy-L-arabinose transferase-like glycosyltransferase
MPQSSLRRAPALLGLVLVTLLGCGLAASTWHVYGHTWDEPEHLAAGMALLDRGHYDYDIQHPPLGRLMLALGPYLAGARSQGSPPPDGKPEGIAILYGSGHYDEYLTLARAGALPFLALLIVMTYVWGRTVLGRGGALFAALLAATAPPLLGHGALAALDVPSAATCLLALDAIRRWLASGGRLATVVWTGLTVGLAIGTKLSALPFVGLGGLVLLALHGWEAPARDAPAEPVRRLQWAGGVALATLLVCVVLTLAYGGRIIYLTDGTHKFNQALGYLFGYAPGTLHDAAYELFAHVPVPEALQWILGGIQALQVHNDMGHLSYLFGDLELHGWRYFYVVALAVKTPLPLLLAGLAGLGLLAWRGMRDRAAAPLVLPKTFGAIFLFVSLFSHINIGVRHVLILVPMLAIGAAVIAVAVVDRIRRSPPSPGRHALAAALGLAVALELAPLAAWPDYLPWFNVLAPHPERVLVDSDLDWGQDFRRLTLRLQALHVPSVSLAYLGTADLPHEDLPPYRLLGPDQRATGWLAVSELARIHAPERFRWLSAYAPIERVGRTIDLYYIPGP